MNIIRKSDCLVLTDMPNGVVKQFFFATREFDLDACRFSSTQERRYAPDLVGFNMENEVEFYRNSWWVNRLATNEERERYLMWMEDRGVSFNQNTVEINE